MVAHTMLDPSSWLGVPPGTWHAHWHAPLALQYAHIVTLRAFPCRAQPRALRLAAQQSVSGYSGRSAAGLGRCTAEQERTRLHTAAGCGTAAENVARKATHALATSSAAPATQTERDGAAQLELRPARRSARATRLDWSTGPWDGSPPSEARDAGGTGGAPHGNARTPPRGSELVKYHLGPALMALREGESPSKVLAGQELGKREATQCGPPSLSRLPAYCPCRELGESPSWVLAGRAVRSRKGTQCGLPYLTNVSYVPSLSRKLARPPVSCCVPGFAQLSRSTPPPPRARPAAQAV